MAPAIEKDIIVKRINGIQQELAALYELGKMRFDEFQNNKGLELGQYHLHRALEGVFNIGSHIISRIPGGQATQYSEIALKLGEFGIVDKKFAEEKLVQMARYRNRLVHFYAEVTAEEVYNIIHDNLVDIETFLESVKNVLEHPDQVGLIVE